MTTSPVRIDPSDLPQSWRDVVSPPSHIVQRCEQHLRRFVPGTLDTAALQSLVQLVAADPETWESLIVVDPSRRRYRLAYEDSRLDLWVLSWMSGQATGFHDHGNSSVALTVVQGSVTERHPSIGAHPAQRVLEPGTVHVGGSGYVHAVGHHAGAPAVTIHAYSPPLTQVGQFRATSSGRIWREVQHGRQELVDHSIDRHLG